MYKIWCEVSGGITGYRTGFLKRAGKIHTFDNRDEAQQEVDRLTDKASKRIHGYADHKYSVTK